MGDQCDRPWLVALRNFRKWHQDILNGGAVYSAPGRKALEALKEQLRDPARRAVVDARIAEVNARLAARRLNSPDQYSSADNLPLILPGSLSLPRPLIHEIIGEMLDGDNASEIADSTDLVRGIEVIYDQNIRRIPSTRQLPKKSKKREKRRIRLRVIALLDGMRLLAGSPCLSFDHKIIMEVALLLIRYALRARNDDE